MDTKQLGMERTTTSSLVPFQPFQPGRNMLIHALSEEACPRARKSVFPGPAPISVLKGKQKQKNAKNHKIRSINTVVSLYNGMDGVRRQQKRTTAYSLPRNAIIQRNGKYLTLVSHVSKRIWSPWILPVFYAPLPLMEE